ncbi:MAG: hypothetical protein KDI49_01840 [Gammaproteobacteria bacterium]|nr:hypothetical protein [Gammaproteobacteria bacterium]MCB1870755.1 hypothetical protein [Gammaproteobacteria bacterium]MCB1881243.1 hypothetical protein [Gammaproteobacteria bacterium]
MPSQEYQDIPKRQFYLRVAGKPGIVIVRPSPTAGKPHHVGLSVGVQFNPNETVDGGTAISKQTAREAVIRQFRRPETDHRLPTKGKFAEHKQILGYFSRKLLQFPHFQIATWVVVIKLAFADGFAALKKDAGFSGSYLQIAGELKLGAGRQKCQRIVNVSGRRLAAARQKQQHGQTEYPDP